MHELSITEHLLDRCLREAEARHGARIRTIRLCIGPLRGIVPDCIQVYLDMLAEGTAAEGARIEAEILPDPPYNFIVRWITGFVLRPQVPI